MIEKVWHLTDPTQVLLLCPRVPASAKNTSISKRFHINGLKPTCSQCCDLAAYPASDLSSSMCEYLLSPKNDANSGVSRRRHSQCKAKSSGNVVTTEAIIFKFILEPGHPSSAAILYNNTTVSTCRHSYYSHTTHTQKSDTVNCMTNATLETVRQQCGLVTLR